ncbi:MAG: TIGR03617 family F420-dependent LLM class oxidoreductase [Deltaproteobacteria bacterium]|nr:TIGR03617 family F420-dependent LLM class oxidoreductase [Deltaproteobacteria bacterium]MBW2392664.1 TIGR03617 family F420-dependent LLM class oxidoreductase [Deltaproteobacteria bacterium]
MGFRVQTVILGPDTDQYAGDGQGTTDIRAIAAAARRCEELGFDGLTAPEAGHDPFLPLVVAAEHTQSIKLGTNVAIAFPRSPMVTAQLAWDLQNLSGGRFQLGLGTQVKGHVERRYASNWTSAPGPRLRDYLLCVKAMFETFQTGARPDFEGEHYRFTLMNPFFNPGPIEHPDIPIHLAAVNPCMARLAGELGDGLRLHPIATFRYTREVILPAIAEGARKAARQTSEIDLIGAPFLAIANDEAGVQTAKQALKQHIAFYASTPTYHAVLEFHGWEGVGQELHRLSRAGGWKEMPNQITDEMLGEWAIVGTRDELVTRVRERCSDIFSTVLLDLPPELRRDEAWLSETITALHREAGKTSQQTRRTA